jgi:hypothetical protein
MQQKLIANVPENALNARKRKKTPENAAVARSRLSPICRKTPQNTGKQRKTPQNAAKHRKYHELAISLLGTKYLGGLKKPPPFQVC